MTTTTDDRTVYQPTAEEVALATDWHGGQASMLYAIASTGALSLGTVRPLVSTVEPGAGMVHRSMSDAEWRADLAWRLLREVREIVTDAAAQDETDDRDTASDWAGKLGPLVDELETIAEDTASE